MFSGLSVATFTFGHMKTRVASLLILSAASAAACSPASGASSPEAAAAGSGGASTQGVSAPAAAVAAGRQVSDANGLTVTATWGGPEAGAVFLIAMDTHIGSLDSLDLEGAILRNDRGQQLTGASWSAPAGGHHRTGQLTFAGDAAAVLQGSTWVELVLPNVGGVPERVLRWSVGA